MNGATVARRAAFVATWRMLASGRERDVVMSVVGTITCAIWVSWFVPPFMFSPTLAMLLMCFGPSTWLLETAIGDRLAFMSLVPQPVATRWLLLAPQLALGLLGSVAMVAAGRGPAIAVISFGSVCWIVGATRWLRRIPYWPLALPLVLVGPVGIFFVLRVGGGWAAAAVASALGLAAIAFQPRAWLGVGSDARTRRGRAQVVAQPGIARQAVSSPERSKGSWLRAAARFMRLVQRPTIVLDLFMFPLAVLCILMFHYPSLALMLVTISVPAYVIAVAFAGEVNEFVGPRPFSQGQRWVGGLLYPLLVTFGFSALMLPCLSLDWMNGGGLPGRLFKHPFLRDVPITYLRDVLGATFLPEKWPASGLSADQWSRVRPLLWLDLLRTTLFAVAALFVRATLPLPKDAKTRVRVPPIDFGLFMLIMGCVLLLSTGRAITNFVPPWWFGAILAAVAIVRWSRKVRPVKPTGSSTAG